MKRITHCLLILLSTCSLSLAFEENDNYFTDTTDASFSLQNSADFESQDTFFSQDFETINTKNIPSRKSVIQRKNPSKIVSVASNNGPMLTNLPNSPTINTKVMNDDLFKQCLQMVEFLYLSTKRYKPDSLIFPGNLQPYDPQLSRSSLYNDLTNLKINIFGTLQGTNGGKEGSDIGLFAYRKLEQENRLQLFIVLEGSQGETFEFLGGIGGASWRSNLEAKKQNDIDAKNLNIDKKYLLKGDGKLSFHSGYYSKIFTSKIFFERNIRDLFNKLNIFPFESLNINNKNLDANTLQKEVDAKRKISVDVYIFGHSQGGGLTQIAAPYYTTFIGEYLYGKTFDNKLFNTAHAICLSPSRAIGDVYTLNVIKNVLGEGNIFGYSSNVDIVTCVPLGNNINYSNVKKLGLNAMLKILKIISFFLPKNFSELASTIASVSTNYETLPIFAYETTENLISNYCKYSCEALKDRLNAINQSNNFPVESITRDKFNAKEFEKSEKKKIQKEIKSLEKTQSEINKISKRLNDIKENYFKSHTSNKLKSTYYFSCTAKHLLELFKVCSIHNFIASQHFGTEVLLKFKIDSKTYFSSECLFNHKLLEGNLQKALNNGIEYEKNKHKIINGK